MAELSAVFRRPFDEQVAALRLRLGDLVGTQAWDDLRGNQHDRAFMVAGAMKADLLADLGGAMEKAISEGTTLDQLRRDWRDIVTTRGWHGWTGEGSKRGEAWRTRVFYQTNIATSYAAGRRAQLVAGNFKYWVYRHGGSADPRIHHLALDGIVLPPDHPFWRLHFPPNGWGCSCRVFGTNSLAGARRLGGDPKKTLPDGWDRIDPKKGTPRAIDRGWDHAPGLTVADTINAMTAKTTNWPYELAKAFLASLPEETGEALGRAMRARPSTGVDLRRYAERALGQRNGAPIDGDVAVEPFKTLGLVSRAQRSRIAELTDLDVTGFDFVVDPSAVKHVIGKHGAAAEALRGQIPIGPSDFAVLPLVLDAPDEIQEAGSNRLGRRLLRFERVIGGKRYFATMEVRSQRRRMIAMTTFYARVSGAS
ncbi:MAG: phage minor head protein [Pseudomonadota bacterium]